METHDLKFRRGLSAAKRKSIRDRYEKLISKRKKQFDKLHSPVLQLAKRFNKELKPIVTKADEKTLARLRKQTAREVGLALLKDNNPRIHDAQKIKSVIARFRSRFKAEVKNAAQLLSMKKRQSGEIRSAFETVTSNFTFLDDISVIDLPELEFDPAFATVFEPPYEFQDVNDIRAGFAQSSTPQVDARIGFVSYRFFMEHESRNWFNDPRGISAYVGVGVSFTMPRTGVIKVVLTMQSTLAFLHARIKDNWGCSDGYAQISAGVYVNVLHPNNTAVNEVMMTNLLLTTDGDDVVSFIDNLPRETPYMVTLTSTGAFAAGETVQLIAGTVVKTHSYVNDMTAELSAAVSWQVKRMFVQVV